MTDLIVKLAKLTPNQIHNHLVKHLPQPMHETIKRDVEEYKQQRKSEKLKSHYQHLLWRQLLRDLHYELANTRVGSRYQSARPAPEREAAFDAYIKVMEKLSALIEHSYMLGGETPTHVAKAKNVPNNGEHWTDWVPEHVKERVRTLFDGIPYAPKTKRKLPFQRTARPMRHSSAKTKREVLMETVRTTMDGVAQMQLIEDSEKLRTKYKQLSQAQAWLENATDSTAMPRTWHGVLRLMK
jgi:hypothetical protein